MRNWRIVHLSWCMRLGCPHAHPVSAATSCCNSNRATRLEVAA